MTYLSVNITTCQGNRQMKLDESTDLTKAEIQGKYTEDRAGNSWYREATSNCPSEESTGIRWEEDNDIVKSKDMLCKDRS